MFGKICLIGLLVTSCSEAANQAIDSKGLGKAIAASSDQTPITPNSEAPEPSGQPTAAPAPGNAIAAKPEAPIADSKVPALVPLPVPAEEIVRVPEVKPDPVAEEDTGAEAEPVSPADPEPVKDATPPVEVPAPRKLVSTRECDNTTYKTYTVGITFKMKSQTFSDGVTETNLKMYYSGGGGGGPVFIDTAVTGKLTSSDTFASLFLPMNEESKKFYGQGVRPPFYQKPLFRIVPYTNSGYPEVYYKAATFEGGGSDGGIIQPLDIQYCRVIKAN